MEEVAHLLRALAWPAVAVFALSRFHQPIVDLVRSLGEWLRAAQKVKLRAFGASFEMVAGVARDLIQSPSKDPEHTGETDAAEFARLAADYATLSIADPAARVARRRNLADRLGRLAITLRRSRKELAGGSEGDLVALATAIVLEPRRDMPVIEAAAARVAFRFTAYRIVLALAPTLAASTISEVMRERVLRVLDIVETNANAHDDPPLQRLIASTRFVIEQG